MPRPALMEPISTMNLYPEGLEAETVVDPEVPILRPGPIPSAMLLQFGHENAPLLLPPLLAPLEPTAFPIAMHVAMPDFVLLLWAHAVIT